NERELIKSVEGEDYLETTGAIETASEKGYTAKEHTMARPTFEVNGIYGGYQGEGTKTIIPQQQQLKLRAELCLIKILKKFKTYLNNILKNINQRELMLKQKKKNFQLKRIK